MADGNILVIDDNEDVRVMLCECLRDCGYEVTSACDGEDGLRQMENMPLPQLVITDIIMPHKEGLETIMEIRQKYPSVKVMAISGGGRAKVGDFLQMAQKLGVDATMPKPINIPELEKAVEQLIG